MFYRPKFCCNCGEKIERTDWKLWTSRRFCDFCEVDHKPYDLAIKGGAAVIVIFGVFGLANVWLFRSSTVPVTGGDAQISTKPVRLVQPANRKPDNGPIPDSSAADAERSLQVQSETEASELTPAEPSKQRKNQEKSSDNPIYFCGAMTKKGTPCTRRVKSPGRCWQHVGKPSAIPSKSSETF